MTLEDSQTCDSRTYDGRAGDRLPEKGSPLSAVIEQFDSHPDSYLLTNGDPLNRHVTIVWCDISFGACADISS
jgi:hypothetical protein